MDTPSLRGRNIEAILDSLVQAGRSAFEQNLKSIVLFGSAAEGRLRPTSDLNLMFVLLRFDARQADSFREPVRMAHAAARASVMFLLESELTVAAEAFAVKFADMGRRHRVLFGEDVLAPLIPSRQARRQRLRQVLLNTTLRLRERYTNLHEEQLPLVIAETAGALRSAAGALLELEGQTVVSSREALARFAESLGNPDMSRAVSRMSTARESRSLPAGEAGPTVIQILSLLEALSLRTEKLAG